MARLEYEAYEPMAKKELLKLCARLRERWPAAEGVAVHHRLGVVGLTEASVVIAVSSPHRRVSFMYFKVGASKEIEYFDNEI